MSCKSVHVSVLLAQECGPGVLIGVGNEEVAQGDAGIAIQMKDQPAETAVSHPQPDSSVAQQPGADGRVVLGDHSDVFVR